MGICAGEDTEEADEPAEAAEGPRHCAICKDEMEYAGGTHRPSTRRVMEFLWDDIVRTGKSNCRRTVDAHPEPRVVRTDTANPCFRTVSLAELREELHMLLDAT